MAARVLVVDDEPMVSDSLKRLLAAGGYEVATATCGSAALSLLREATFDLVMIDYQMPGMDGEELAEAVKALNPREPVIMITGYPESLARKGRSIAGVDLLIGKPFDSQELLKAVSRLITKS